MIGRSSLSHDQLMDISIDGSLTFILAFLEQVVRVR